MSDAQELKSAAATGRARLEPPDLSEKGGLKGGQPQRSDNRLFMQLTAFGGCRDARAAADYWAGSAIDAVVYEDLNDPFGIAVLTLSGDPDAFVDVARPLCARGPMAELALKPEYSMCGPT